MTRSLQKKAKGFTLLELLIVVAIIGVLAAIAIPNLLNASTKSKYARALADTKLIVSQATLYLNDKNSYPALADLQGGAYMSNTTDPFGGATDNYKYTKATATTPAAANTVGADGDGGTWDGTAVIGANSGAGFSSKVGCSVGTTAPNTVRC